MHASPGRTWLAVLIALTTLSATRALAAQDPVEAAVRELAGKYVAAYNAGDAEAAAELYAPDATHTYVLGFTHRGRDAIARGIRELLLTPSPGSTISLTVMRVRPLSDDLAVSEEEFTLAGLRGPDGSPLPEMNGRCQGVYERLDEGWRAAAIQCMVPPERMLPDDGPVGVWQLAEVDGVPVPCTPVHPDAPPDAPRIQVLEASLEIDADGTFHQHMAYGLEDGRRMDRDFTGRWAREGYRWVLHWEGAGGTPAWLEGDRFVYDNVGMLFGFVREP